MDSENEEYLGRCGLTGILAQNHCPKESTLARSLVVTYCIPGSCRHHHSGYKMASCYLLICGSVFINNPNFPCISVTPSRCRILERIFFFEILVILESSDFRRSWEGAFLHFLVCIMGGDTVGPIYGDSSSK